MCSHELRRNETQNGIDFIRSFWPTWDFKLAWDFRVKNILPETKWIRGDSLDIAFDAHAHCRCGFDIRYFDRNEISFRVLKYHLNTTRNEMPTHVHQDIGSFWNAAEMKRHVNRTCFYAGLRSQTGLSSFRLSWERTLSHKV